MDEQLELKLQPDTCQAGIKTSGQRNAQIVIRIVGLPVVDIRAIRLEIADIHEVAIRIAGVLCMHISIKGSREARFVRSGGSCINTWRHPQYCGDPRQKCASSLLYGRDMSVNMAS